MGLYRKWIAKIKKNFFFDKNNLCGKFIIIIIKAIKLNY